METTFDFSNVGGSLEIVENNVNNNPPVIENTPNEIEKNDKPIQEINLEEIIKVQNDDEEIIIDDKKKPSVENNEDNKNKGNSPAPKETKKSSNIPTLVLSRALMEQGIIAEDVFNEEELSKEIEEVGEAQALLNIINKQREYDYKEIESKLDVDFKEYVALKDLGVSSEDAKKLIGNKLEFEKITENEIEDSNNQDIRKKVIAQYYKLTTNHSDERINKLVDRAIATGEDVEEAKEALGTIKEMNKKMINDAKQLQIDKQKDDEKRQIESLEVLKNTVNGIDEVIPGQKINKQTKENLLKMITTPVAKDDAGRPLNAIWHKRLQDPAKFDTILAYMLKEGFFDGKPAPIAKAKQTDALKLLEENLSKGSSTRFNANPNLGSVDVQASDLLKTIQKLV